MCKHYRIFKVFISIVYVAFLIYMYFSAEASQDMTPAKFLLVSLK